MTKLKWAPLCLLFFQLAGCIQLQPTADVSAGKSAGTSGAGGPYYYGSPQIWGFIFTAPSSGGTISGNTISIRVPTGANVTNLVALFNFYGNSVKIGTVDQVNGVTVNDFTNPVAYTVYGYDGSTRTYTVTVTTSSSDIFPPVMTAVTTTPTSVSSFPSTVTVKVYYAETGGSGYSSGGAYLCSPTQQLANGLTGGELYVSLTNMGTYLQGTVTLQNYHEPGIWKVCYVFMSDSAGNYNSYGTIYSSFGGNYYFGSGNGSVFNSGMALQGSVTVTGSVLDNTPPTLTSVVVTPTSASVFPATITVRAYYTETGSGYSSGYIALCSPTYMSAFSGQILFASVTNMGAYIQGQITLQNYHENGNWQVCYITMDDVAGNSRAYSRYANLSTVNYYYSSASSNFDSGVPLSSYVAINSTEPDVNAPVMTAVTITPSSTSVYPATVTVRVDYTESGSGLSNLYATLCSPTSVAGAGGTTLTASMTNLGAYAQGTVTLQSYHETGNWKVCRLGAVDVAGNNRYYFLYSGQNPSVYYSYVNGVLTNTGVSTGSGMQKN